MSQSKKAAQFTGPAAKRAYFRLDRRKPFAGSMRGLSKILGDLEEKTLHPTAEKFMLSSKWRTFVAVSAGKPRRQSNITDQST